MNPVAAAALLDRFRFTSKVPRSRPTEILTSRAAHFAVLFSLPLRATLMLQQRKMFGAHKPILTASVAASWSLGQRLGDFIQIETADIIKVGNDATGKPSPRSTETKRRPAQSSAARETQQKLLHNRSAGNLAASLGSQFCHKTEPTLIATTTISQSSCGDE